MRIGEAARVSGLTIKAIRHYEAVGLLPGVQRRGAYREFADADVERLRLIGHCRSLGFSVADVGRVLQLVADAAPQCPDTDRMARLVVARLAEVRAEIAALEQQAQGLEAVVRYLAERGAQTS